MEQQLTPTMMVKAKLYKIKGDLLEKGAHGKYITTTINLGDETIDYMNVFIRCEKRGYCFTVWKKDITDTELDLIIDKIFPGNIVE